jgi:hypothetical protein
VKRYREQRAAPFMSRMIAEHDAKVRRGGWVRTPPTANRRGGPGRRDARGGLISGPSQCPVSPDTPAERYEIQSPSAPDIWQQEQRRYLTDGHSAEKKLTGTGKGRGGVKVASGPVASCSASPGEPQTGHAQLWR